jgi:uncharacterized protein (TIRG00374 family)
MAIAAIWAGGRQAWTALLHVPPQIIPIMLAMSLLNYAMRCWRWLLFSRALALQVAPAQNALYYVAGFALTTTPGKMGEAMRLWLLHRHHAIRYDSSAALLVADRLSDAVAITAVVGATVFWFAHYLAVALIAVLAVAAITTICMRPALLLWALDAAFARVRRAPRLFVRARRVIRGLATLAPPRILGPALLMSIVGWSAEGLSFYVLLHALGSALNPLACVFIFAFSMLVGAISVLPGGLGSTEATMVGLLASQGVPVPTAIVATGLVRVTTLWFAVGLGLVALPFTLRPRGVGPAPTHA